MSVPKDEEMKVRVPAALKKAFIDMAAERFTSESALAREALLEYLARHGITSKKLQEASPAYTAGKPATPPATPESLHKEAVEYVREMGRKIIARRAKPAAKAPSTPPRDPASDRKSSPK